jgi:hypothetical protein
LQIYKGSIAFIVLQIIMVAVIVFNPTLVTGNLEKAVVVDDATVSDMLNNMSGLEDEAASETPQDAPASTDGLPTPPAEDAEIDPAKALLESMKQ